MQCPYCSGDSSVTETRVTADGMRRRRVCTVCKRRFTTYEKLGAPGLKVSKRDGTVEPFDGDKLFRALQRVAAHRNIADEDLRRAVMRLQIIRGAHEVFDVRREIRIGELPAARAEPGEIEAQHRDAARGQRLPDERRGFRILGARKTMREDRVSAFPSPRGVRDPRRGRYSMRW